MAIVCRQTKIWQELELERELPPGLQDVRDFIAVIDEFDGDLVASLRRERGRGRPDHPVAAMWNLIAVSLLLRHGKFSEMLAEMGRNSDLARVLGFEEIGPNQYKIPSKSAVSRFHVKLKEEYLEQIQAVFDRTALALGQESPNFGKHSSLDASDVRTHARPPRKRSEDPGGESQEDAEDAKASSDPEASWSVKTKAWENGEGKSRKETKSTYGFKLYGVCDTAVPGISSLEVRTGSTPDQRMAIPMIDDAIANLPDRRLRTVSMDKGFDSEANVRKAFERGVCAIVPVREVPDNLEKLPREDREEKLRPGGNLVYDRYTGEVACYERLPKQKEGSRRRTMPYAGFESDRCTHKFRCPLGASAAQCCNSFSSCAAGSSGSQGRQVRVPMTTDYRRFAPVYPRSHRWKRLYRGRSAIERINGYLKEVLQLERHCLRGLNAIKLRVLLAGLTLNARTLLALRREKASAAAPAA